MCESFPKVNQGLRPHINLMNRRQFHQLAAASIAAPAAFAGQTASAAATALPKSKVLWAAALARAQNRVSPNILEYTLKSSPAEARALCAHLLETGVIKAPNAAGISRAVAPMLRGAVRPAVSRAVATSTAPRSTLKDLRAAWRTLDTKKPERQKRSGQVLGGEAEGDQLLENSG